MSGIVCLTPVIHVPCVRFNKRYYWMFSSSPCSQCLMTEYRTEQRVTPLSPVYFSCFWKVFYFPVFSHGMEAATRFTTLAHLDLPFFEYTREFGGLAVAMTLEHATINSLFWLVSTLNYHRPVDLPDTTGLSWREGVFRCLGSVRVRVRTRGSNIFPHCMYIYIYIYIYIYNYLYSLAIFLVHLASTGLDPLLPSELL